ncbi:hypothetical protein ACLKOZ_16945 [Arthrobacter sp. R4]|uniref:hypothetical protein n=1 Tax=Arthrobacter sp. R4 TaxID=644417 RepID=UPI003ED9A149
MTEPVVSLSLTLSPILSEHPPVDHRGVHQLRIGAVTFVNINPETARQWLPTIQRIAEEK